jgi:enterochelin esterase family protein
MKTVTKITAALLLATAAYAQTPPPGVKLPFPMGPTTPYERLVSPEVAADGRITFRFYAPKAASVSVIPWFGDDRPPMAMTKADDGVWSVTTEPIAPGAYRYRFTVDGATVPDPRNPQTGAMNREMTSLVAVPGGADDVSTYHAGIPHGAVVMQHYDSAVAGPERRLHVYLPPGYSKGKDYPVLYLLHGGGDGDLGWLTEGHAAEILDNLIAQGKAKPMVVVFPDGIIKGSWPMGEPEQDKFGLELRTVIVPLIEAHYNVSKRSEDRALAGLSMGGIQTLNIALLHTDEFRYVGVFSSGWFPDTLKSFEAKYGGQLKANTDRLKLLWIAHGKTDIARANSLAMIKMLQNRGATLTWEETPGGHTMVNWRRYLSEFAPLLFR